MTWFDIGVIVVIGLSVVLSVVRGAVREILALAAWVLAFLGAQYLAPHAVPYLPAGMTNDSLRMLTAFTAAFLVLLFALTLVAIGLSRAVRSVGLGTVDRILGAAFGLARGVAIALVLVLVAGFTTLPQHSEWRQALLSAPLEALANAVKEWLPYDFSKRIRYS
jgi:membrane protein required for colicin V production